jgi:trehalose/maltose hydrolase-like predicted phosphorylase
VIKQADVVLAMFLLGDEFSVEEKRRIFDFYDPLTIRGARLRVEIEPRQASFTLEEGDDLRLECCGEQVQLSEKSRTVVVPYSPPEPAASPD